MVMRVMGLTWRSLRMRSLQESERKEGILKEPLLIFLNKVGMWSSLNGSFPHTIAYNITPQLHTSTSSPEYNSPDITSILTNFDYTFLSNHFLFLILYFLFLIFLILFFLILFNLFFVL